MVTSGLTSSVIHRASPGDGYVRMRDGGLITAVAQFLFDEAALLDEWRLDEWLALFDPVAAKYLIPSPEDLGDNPATTLYLVNDSMSMLSGRVTRLKSKHAHAESPRSRTRRQITNLRVWQGPDDLLSRSVFDVTRMRGGAVDRYVGVYEHQLLLGELIARVDRNFVIFPNLIILDVMGVVVRKLEPTSAGHTRIIQWSLATAGEDADLRARRLQNFITFQGPGASRRPMISRRSTPARPGSAPAPACRGRTSRGAWTGSTAASPAATPTRGKCAPSGDDGRR